MNLQISHEILKNFQNDIKIFFYNSWCEWTKVDITENFSKENLEYININWKNIFFETKDKKYLENAKILPFKDTKNPHSKTSKYLFTSPLITSRCSCSTSFSFENKLISSQKLKLIKNALKNKA